MTLPKMDVIVAVDLSGSMNDDMNDPNAPYTSPRRSFTACGRSRWMGAQETLRGLCTKVAAEVDPNGIDILGFSGSLRPLIPNVTPENIHDAFNKLTIGGGTNTHLAVAEAYRIHKERRATNSEQRTCLIVGTDGTPDDITALQKTIADITKEVKDDPNQFRTSFFQIGNVVEATEHLTKMDDDLPGAVCDIVDRTTAQELESMPFTEWFNKTISD